jgi:GT2 family glycosyltransferase
MLYFYSTRKKDEKNYNKILKSCKTNVKIHEFENEGTHSLTQCYNLALNLCEENEILVLAHDDVELEYGWDEKIIEIFENTDYGIVGVAGTTSLNNSGVWWENRADLAGIVSHQKIVNNKPVKYDTKFSEAQNFVMSVCCVDGVFIALKKDRIKHQFNEKIGGFHFYDISFCVDNFLAGVKIGVTTSFKIHHLSVGQLSPQWQTTRNLFLSDYGKNLPIKINPNIDDLVKKIPSNVQPVTVGVIILTKNKIDYLIKCISSLIEKTSENIKLKIIVGDTGSTDKSLKELENFINNYDFKANNILIEHLPFYNFAKNNNVICRKYLTQCELLLCCNNDIELINNALDSMVETYQRNPYKCGTIGCRLLYPNLRVQHGGIVIYGDKQVIKGATHFGLKSYYSAKTKLDKNILGCTGAFLLIKTQLFLDLGGFNENTTECFEDVILNIETRSKKNKVNYYQGDAACFHHESLTRNESPDQTKRIKHDFNHVLMPKIIQYKKTLKDYIIII